MVCIPKSTGAPETADRRFAIGLKLHDHGFEVYVPGFRYYSPSLGRWVSRDPIGEWGGVNQHSFVSNVLSRTDVLGLLPRSSCPKYSDLRGNPLFAFILADMRRRGRTNPSRCFVPYIHCSCWVGNAGQLEVGRRMIRINLNVPFGGTPLEALGHELIHMYDYCRRRFSVDPTLLCTAVGLEAQFRSELRAYYFVGRPLRSRRSLCRAAFRSVVDASISAGCSAMGRSAAAALEARCNDPADPLLRRALGTTPYPVVPGYPFGGLPFPRLFP